MILVIVGFLNAKFLLDKVCDLPENIKHSNVASHSVVMNLLWLRLLIRGVKSKEYSSFNHAENIGNDSLLINAPSIVVLKKISVFGF